MRTPAVLVGLALTTVLTGQVPSRRPQNTDPARPPLVIWQRTLADALHLAKTKKLPLLVVANQDNEPACESLANDRYRSKGFAKLANRYVAVIGSVFRHNPRDFDDQGRRILCPRFGCVTCGEHIAMEPKIFEKYFRGRRTAPRHIGIGTDGKRMFDRFLDTSLTAVDAALRRNATQDGPTPDLKTKDRSVTGLAKSRADADRVELEQRFLKADEAGKLAILRAATGSGSEHPDLARLALMNDSARVRKAATALVVATASEASLDLILRFLGRAPNDAEFSALMPALDGPAKTNKSFQRARVIRRAIAAKSERVDPARWAERFRDASVDANAEVVTNEELAALDKTIDENTKKASAGDPGGKLWFAVAKASFRYALNRIQTQKDPSFLLQDAENAAKKAIDNGMAKVEAAILRTRVLWLLNKQKEAGEQAILALGSDALAAQAATRTGFTVLEVYARTQREPLNQPIEGEDDYPHQAVTETHRGYQALVQHPLATATHAKDQLDFLLYLGARRAAGIANRLAVKRFPADPNLQNYLMNQARWEGGSVALERTYEKLQRQGRSAAMDYYAGYAMLLVAEDRVRNNDAEAGRAYNKAIDNFERSGATDRSYQDYANHYAVLARGGLAKLAVDRGDLDTALRFVLAAAAARPASFGSADGLGNTLQRTTRRLRRKLDADKKDRLDKKLAELGLKLGS